MSPSDAITIPARRGRAARVAKGRSVTVINTHGSQVVDTWAFAAADIAEFMSMEHSRAAFRHVTPRIGDSFVTNRRRPILTVLADATPGVHDTLIAACDLFRYRDLGVPGYHDNCADNLRLALAAIGLEVGDVPQPLNLWMNIPVDAGAAIRWLPPVSAAGDHVVLRAEMDLVAVMSACPQDIIPINGAACRPADLRFEVLES